MTSLVAVVVGAMLSEQTDNLGSLLRRSPEPEPEIYANAKARISSGEQLLFADNLNPFKKAGIRAYRKEHYAEAEKNFQHSLSFHRDPETLIYLNNSQVSQEESYLTLAVAIALPEDLETEEAKEILQGVAQAQKEFIEEGNAVKVLIGDDDDEPDSAAMLAQKFVEMPEVLGVIGHLSSDSSLNAGSIYQDAGLVMVSPLSTAMSLSGLGSYIFRTVPNDFYASKAIADYLVQEQQITEVAIFYSSHTTYSVSLKHEIAEHLKDHGQKKTLTIDTYDPNFDVEDAFETLRAQNIKAIALLTDGETRPQAIEILKQNNQLTSCKRGESR
ncbi:ABC transporter substrate-binding protein [[Leptolyngbya] sp. PCC 7376]|uniref:ABC transporter substrate-binding protein n=1 Tax=[Leptolyngbya] sp. PCC 7376 TaxID=111781 RepID=UPI00135A6860|nr:ABC transporter substrate-binding protein [[Leptolyngbya] sp. PCC 7376]